MVICCLLGLHVRFALMFHYQLLASFPLLKSYIWMQGWISWIRLLPFAFLLFQTLSHPPVHLFWWSPSINKESVLFGSISPLPLLFIYSSIPSYGWIYLAASSLDEARENFAHQKKISFYLQDNEIYNQLIYIILKCLNKARWVWGSV